MKSKINEYVDAVAQTRDQITITKNGSPAAVLIGVEEWESIQETLHWLSQPGIVESVAQSEADITSGQTSVRTKFGPNTRCLGGGSPEPMSSTNSYSTRFTATARRDLNNLPPRILPAVIEFAFGDLARAPRRVGKPLGVELAGQHSARRGPYHLLYRIDDETNTVWVHRIDHCADVYRTM